MSNSYSVFSSFENLRGIVRQAKDRKRANSVVTKLSKSRGKRTVRQRFFNQNKVALFHFLLLPITTEAMGIWRFAGAFAVVKRQGECGSKTAGMHVSQPMNIGVCYALVLFFLFTYSESSTKFPCHLSNVNLSILSFSTNDSKDGK